VGHREVGFTFKNGHRQTGPAGPFRANNGHRAIISIDAGSRSAELAKSQSALSHAMKSLEERLGVRLLSRTTRSVSTTEAVETFLRSLRPALSEISAGVDAVGASRGKLSGTVRIVATEARIAAHSVRAR
jgi:Bacterial regulatory helix-turn-helix protein, lysR family